MANKEKKLEHIQVKDNGIKSSQRLGDTLNEAKQLLERNIFDGLLSSANEKSLVRYKIAQNVFLSRFSRNTQSVIKNAKNEVKKGLESDKTVNLTPKQVNRLTTEVNDGLLKLGDNAVKAYQRTLQDILLNVKSASDLKEQIGKHIKSGLDIDVIYKDGKKYKFDTYFEMKARTDIQQDIGKNMVDAGREAGIIFYITSFYGDCAPDHANYQGRIYYDENWESMAPKDRLEEVRKYIAKLDDEAKSLELPNGSVRTVMENKPFLTTRPNCRHYFQYIDIDSVLGAKTPDDVKNLRQERDLNFNGKYKPDKYQALQQQRLNERKIRDAKADMVKQQQQLIIDPEDKFARSRLEIDKANIRNYQKAQRELEKQYSNIERRYDREKVGNRVDLGVNDLTKNQDNGKIDVEIDEMTPCLIKTDTNEIVNTEFKELEFKKYKGFIFDWSKKQSSDSKLEALYAEGDNRIQGLISYHDVKSDNAIYVEAVESARHNSKYVLGDSAQKEYTGVGAHLFAQAVKRSFEKGYHGFIYFTAKTKLIKYYIKELGATQVYGQQMCIDEDAAKKLFVRYYGEEEYKKYEKE